MERLMVKIPASITKKKRARTTFFSAEVTKRLAPMLNRIDDDDLVFGENTKLANILYLERILHKLGMDQKYDSTNRFKINTHSFRAFFITKISRHDQNLAKFFAEQKGYLLQYDRLTDEEKLQYYLKYEPDLMIYDQSKNEEKITSLKLEYNELLMEWTTKALHGVDMESITDKDIQAMMYYAITETMKDEYIKDKFDGNEEDSITNTVSDILIMFGLQEAYATCPSTTNPSYKQEIIDINGGAYGGHYFNGDNDLYLVLYTDNASTCERTYSLSFYDEDHPEYDAAYDALRWIIFNRTFDIESFTIRNNNEIIFDNTYSSYRDFDCLQNGAGCRYTHTKTYNPGSTVYVSNTWNI